MSLIIRSGVTSAEAIVGTDRKAIRVTNHPAQRRAWRTVGGQTGVLAAALAANANIFAFRNDGPRPIYVRRVGFGFQPIAAFTGNQRLEFALYGALGWLTAASGGTALSQLGIQGAHRTNTAPPTAIDARISTTAALTAGTATALANPYAIIPTFVTTAAGVGTIPYREGLLLDQSTSDMPLVFEQQEGFYIRNNVVWPAAGTGMAYVSVEYAEAEDHQW